MQCNKNDVGFTMKIYHHSLLIWISSEVTTTVFSTQEHSTCVLCLSFNLVDTDQFQCWRHHYVNNAHVKVIKRTKQQQQQQQQQPDGCIVWNAHNTVFGSKRACQCATKNNTAL